MEQRVILEASDITKTFPGVRALDGVHFSLHEGEVHALVGENGAGKSTLMNILSGVMKPDSGSIHIDGAACSFSSPLEAAREGVGIVFQELSLIQNLSIAENIFAGRQKTGRMGLIDFRDLYSRTEQLLADFNERIDPRTPVKYLSIAKQQVVEILKAVSHNPRILILDEPTSSLTHEEIGKLFSLIASLQEKGISIIYISHHLQEIFEIAERVTVLRDGRWITTRFVREVDEPEVAALMVGRTIIERHVDRGVKIDRNKPMLSVRGLSHAEHFSRVSFDLFSGEIVGMAGLIGAGRTEIARTIFGLMKPTEGSITLDGKRIHPRSPAEAAAAGIAYTSENRKLDGLFLDMTISENSIAPQLKSFTNPGSGFLNRRKIREFVLANFSAFGIRASSPDAYVRKLSGGNQQKVLLSMWLGVSPKVLIVDEPTKGVDVGAKSEIFTLLRRLADKHVAVLVISSDLLEIIALCDRVLVVKDGRICSELSHDEVTEERVIAYASGVAKPAYHLE
jgi:ABC-type sugar transport system ATPase subunit